jgi:DNA-binding Lrp family transcriptional regulator
VDKVLTVRAILHVFVEPGKLEDVEEALAKMPEVIDIYEVTGELSRSVRLSRKDW